MIFNPLSNILKINTLILKKIRNYVLNNISLYIKDTYIYI